MSETVDVCDVCGSTDLLQIKCKVVCRNCGTILKSCSDLQAATVRISKTRC
jgi:hypothetical protein